MTHTFSRQQRDLKVVWQHILKRVLGLLVLAIFAVSNLSAQEIPYPNNPSKFLHDYTKTLGSEEKERIEVDLNLYKSTRGHSLYVVLIDSTGSNEIETFAKEILKKWGIPNDEVLLVAKNDRKVRVQNGLLNVEIGDVNVKQVIDEAMIPEFKKGDYYSGISAGIKQLSGAQLDTAVKSVQPNVSESVSTDFNFWSFWKVVLFLALAQLGMWLYAIVDILRSDFKDGTNKIIWLIAVIFLPFIGAVMYFLIGRKSKIPA